MGTFVPFFFSSKYFSSILSDNKKISHDDNNTYKEIYFNLVMVLKKVTKKLINYLSIYSYTYNNSMTNLFNRGFVIELKGGYK